MTNVHSQTQTTDVAVTWCLFYPGGNQDVQNDINTATKNTVSMLILTWYLQTELRASCVKDKLCIYLLLLKLLKKPIPQNVKLFPSVLYHVNQYN